MFLIFLSLSILFAWNLVPKSIRTETLLLNLRRVSIERMSMRAHTGLILRLRYILLALPYLIELVSKPFISISIFALIIFVPLVWGRRCHSWVGGAIVIIRLDLPIHRLVGRWKKKVMLIIIEVVRRFYKFGLVLSESCVVSVGVQRVSAILAHQIIIISEIIILIRV